MTNTVLIVDDEVEIALLMERILLKEGITKIKKAHTIQDAWQAFEQISPDLILLDIMLPDGEGYDLCKKIREVSNIPILFMSAKDDEMDKIVGLAIGGDDYITKPFSPKEVAYRIKAHLRRASFTQPTQPIIQDLSVGPFILINQETELLINGKSVQLKAKELGLMQLFMKHPNQILSKETLFESVWGEDFYGADNTVMVHIRRLREKIEVNPSAPEYIITVKGLGYKLVSL